MWRQTGENIYRNEDDVLMIARSFENEFGEVQTLSGPIEDAVGVTMPAELMAPTQSPEPQPEPGFWEKIGAALGF